MTETKQTKRTYGMNWVKTQMMQDIEQALEKHQKIPFINLKFILVRKYGATDKMINDILALYSDMGMMKVTDDFVELVKNDVLREENKPESEDDRARTDNEHNFDEEGQV